MERRDHLPVPGFALRLHKRVDFGPAPGVRVVGVRVWWDEALNVAVRWASWRFVLVLYV